ncbi:uncharacterized protein LOC141707122 [Apium graveolens]|uniref:uncharacterized protein LOC141707122 n=1 Tax=Apium graveolens TaxID=4045 RepID=UPI003D7B4C1F
MPPELSQWDRNDVFRKNERVWNGNVGPRWRDRDRERDRDRDRDRDRERDLRLFRDRHWGFNEFRRPNGYGKQGWQTFTEDFARGPGPYRPNRRFFDDGSCFPIEKYGRDSSSDIRGGSLGQRDWRGHFWDAVPGPHSNGCANMPAHASMKRSADDMLSYNSYPYPHIGNSWDQFYLKDQHYNNSAASSRRRFGRKNSVGLNAQKPLKVTRSGSLYSRGCGIGHSSSPKSSGLENGEDKVPSHLQNPSPLHSHSGNSATGATIAPSEETISRDCGISHSSSPKSLRLNSGEIKVPVHPQDPSLVHYLTGDTFAYATSTPAEETYSSGCGLSHSSSPKSLGLDSAEIKVPLNLQNPSPGLSFLKKTASCAAYAPDEEANSRKKPRLGWGEGLAQFEKIINGSTDTAENDGMIESPKSHSKNYTEPVYSHNSVVALRSSRVQCITEFPSPVTPSTAFCSSPGDDELSVKAVEVDASNLCSSPCPESQNQRDGIDFNLENLDVNGLVTFSSSPSELLPFNNVHPVESDFMRSAEMSKLLVVKADIAKKVEIIESEIDLLENELKTVISDTGNVSTCPTSSSPLQVKCNLNPLEELCASNLIAKPAPLVPNCFGDMMKMSPGGLEGELEESRNVKIDSLGTAASEVAEPLLAGMYFSGKTHKLGESTSNADRSDRKGKSIVHGVKEENCKQIASSRGCLLSVDIKLHGECMSYDLLIASNKDSAHRAAKVISKLLPTNRLVVDHLSFDVSPCWKKKALVKEKLALRKRFLRFKERVITLKYRALKLLWKEDMLRLFTSGSYMFRKKFELSSPVVSRTKPKQRSFIRARISSRAMIPSLVPTSKVINFASRLLGDSDMKLYSSALKMPPLILDNKEKKASRFISNNGLVEDPSTAEKERCMVNPWTSKEKEIFLDRLTTFGKDFRKIASFLDHKTTADCVEFYYKNHKSDCFQRTKKKTEFPKQGKSCLISNFLVTSGKRQASISNAASLDMLGAASVIVTHVEDKLTDEQKCSREVFGTCNSKTLGDVGICKKSSNPDVLGNERESIAADVLDGICGSLSTEAMSSCVTSSMDFGEGYQERKSLRSSVRRPLTPEGTHNVVSETCLDESCGEIDPTDWTDDEKSSFIQAVMSYGKDFTMISQFVRTRSSDQCKVFFSKTRKCLRLDKVMHYNQRAPASDDAKGSVCGDNPNACVVETICNEKSGSRIAEDQLSSNFKENLNGRQPSRTAKMQADFYHTEEHKQMKKLDVEDIERSSDNLVSTNYAEEKAELDLDAGNNIENCRHLATLAVQDIKTGSRGADSKILLNDAIAREDIKADGEVCGNTSGTENLGHEILMPSRNLSGEDAGFADVNSSSLSAIRCAIQGTKTNSSDRSSFLAVAKNPLAKGVLGGENANANLLNSSRKPPIVSSKQCSSCKSHNPVVQSRKRLDHDMASQFDSRKFSNKQNSVKTEKYHKHFCGNFSMDLVDLPQISMGCPVSIMMKNGINGGPSCTKAVSARSKLNAVEHFSAQRYPLQKCNSSKHLDAESELHCMSQYQSKDLSERSFGFRA